MIGKFLNIKPKFDATCFIAPSADMIGAVEIGKYSSVWYNAVLRADINRISLGEYTNIQDGCSLHVEFETGVEIGDHVTVGHNAVLHACRIGDGSLIGMGSVILSGAVIGNNSVVAAGSLVTKDFVVRPNTLVMGSPCKEKRLLSAQEIEENIRVARIYAELIPEYKKMGIKLTRRN